MKRMFGCRYTAFPPANTFDPGTRENGSAVVKPVWRTSRRGGIGYSPCR
jgi:hypothetical protein